MHTCAGGTNALADALARWFDIHAYPFVDDWVFVNYDDHISHDIEVFNTVVAWIGGELHPEKTYSPRPHLEVFGTMFDLEAGTLRVTLTRAATLAKMCA